MAEEPGTGAPAQVESLDLFSMAFSSAAIGMALVAPNGRLRNVNDAMCDITGYSRSELLGRDFQSITHPDDLDADVEHARQLLDGERKSYQMEKRYIRADGRTIWVSLTGSLVRQPSGAPRFFVAQVQDIDARKRAQADLASIFALSNDLLAVASADGILQRVNPAWEAVLGWSRDELEGRPVISLLHADDVERTAREFRAIAASGGTRETFRNRYRCKQGGYRWLEWGTSLAADGSFIGVARDITQRLADEKRLADKTKQLVESNRQLSSALRDLAQANGELKRATSQLERLAMYDSLTGLGNRNLFLRHLDRTIAKASSRGEEFAILIMDLDGFKGVNDVFGHAAGDTVLTEFSDRLGHLLPAAARAYRLGGDEFAILVVSRAGAGLRDAAVLAQSINDTLLTPFRIKGSEQFIRTSIGVAAYPAHGDTSSLLLRKADAAMYQSKRDRGAMAVASDRSPTEVLHNLSMQRDPKPS